MAGLATKGILQTFTVLDAGQACIRQRALLLRVSVLAAAAMFAFIVDFLDDVPYLVDLMLNVRGVAVRSVRCYSDFDRPARLVVSLWVYRLSDWLL